MAVFLSNKKALESAELKGIVDVEKLWGNDILGSMEGATASIGLVVAVAVRAAWPVARAVPTAAAPTPRAIVASAVPAARATAAIPSARRRTAW